MIKTNSPLERAAFEMVVFNFGAYYGCNLYKIGRHLKFKADYHG